MSTNTQSLDRQIGALRAERCHEVYREKASGKATKSRPQLERWVKSERTRELNQPLRPTTTSSKTAVRRSAQPTDTIRGLPTMPS